MSRISVCLSIAALVGMSSFAHADPELAPPPRLVESHVRIESMVGGYQIILTRKATEKLTSALGYVGDGRPYTDIAKIAVKELNDPDAEKKMDLAAFIIKSQAPALKKALDDHMGPNGVIIKVYGIDNKNIPEPPPLAKALGEAFLPEKVKERVKTGMKVINTTPLMWKVEERK